MSKDEIRAAVLEIIEEIAPDEDIASMNDEEPIREQIGLDSMDFLDIVMELRKQYKVEVPEDDYNELRTLASTVAYLEGKM
ncbi:MAG: acyl carrier protein [Planctomycetes bacterium]|nr:acyl carrier protein [Planctomycetota bacterium]